MRRLSDTTRKLHAVGSAEAASSAAAAASSVHSTSGDSSGDGEEAPALHQCYVWTAELRRYATARLPALLAEPEGPSGSGSGELLRVLMQLLALSYQLRLAVMPPRSPRGSPDAAARARNAARSARDAGLAMASALEAVETLNAAPAAAAQEEDEEDAWASDKENETDAVVTSAGKGGARARKVRYHAAGSVWDFALGGLRAYHLDGHA